MNGAVKNYKGKGNVALVGNKRQYKAYEKSKIELCIITEINRADNHSTASDLFLWKQSLRKRTALRVYTV